MVMVVVSMVRAWNYNYNYCRSKLWSPAFLRIIEYGLEVTPSILWLQIFFLAARKDGDGGGDYGMRQEL